MKNPVIAQTYPKEVGRLIRALQSGPRTWRELELATGIKAWLLNHLLARLEEEQFVEHGYPEDPRDSTVARYWLLADHPGYPYWLETEEEEAEREQDAAFFQDPDQEIEDPEMND